MAEQKPRLLRPGGVTLEMLQWVVGAVTVDPAVLHKLADGAQAASPGMKYKHYAPKAKVILVKGTAERYREFVNSKTTAPPRPESCSMLYGNWMNGRKSSWYMPGARSRRAWAWRFITG